MVILHITKGHLDSLMSAELQLWVVNVWNLGQSDCLSC